MRERVRGPGQQTEGLRTRPGQGEDRVRQVFGAAQIVPTDDKGDRYKT